MNIHTLPYTLLFFLIMLMMGCTGNSAAPATEASDSVGYHWADTVMRGRRYVGQVLNGMRDGYGTYYDGEKEWHRGFWKQNRRHGRGSLRSLNCTTTGTWRMGKNTGMYKQLFDNGEYYVGHMLNDRREGRGTYVHLDGRRASGLFHNDTLRVLEELLEETRIHR